MDITIKNNELPTTIDAFARLTDLPAGPLKTKIARMARAVLQASTTVTVEPLTAEEFEIIAKTNLSPGALNFLLPFVDEPRV